jgi:hypothetical protein
MCDIIDEIEAEQLEIVLKRARKQASQQIKEEKPIEVAVH